MSKRKDLHTIFILLLFLGASHFSFSQTGDSLNAGSKSKVSPAIKFGGNSVGFITGELGMLFALPKNASKASHSGSTMCHGPAVSVELGKPGDTLLIAPKLSYEYYSIYYGVRLSAVDYMKGSSHNIYISPEAGMSFGAFFNIFVGANLPVSGEIDEMSTVRVSLIINLYTLVFKKG